MSDCVPFRSRFSGGFYFTANLYECPACSQAVRIRVTHKFATCTACQFSWCQIPPEDKEARKKHQNPFKPIDHGGSW